MTESWEEVHASREWGIWPDDALVRFVSGQWTQQVGFDPRLASTLELGCGAGANLRLLAAEGVRVGGIDISETAVHRARENLQKWVPGWIGLNPARGRSIVQGSVTSLPWLDRCVDLVIDCECVCYLSLEEASFAYNEAWRVTRSGGYLFVRAFESGCFVGDANRGIGPVLSHAARGPLSALPATRLTSTDELLNLVRPWKPLSVVRLTRTLPENPEWAIIELVVIAVKD